MPFPHFLLFSSSNEVVPSLVLEVVPKVGGVVRVYSQDISRHKYLTAWLEPFLKCVSITVRLYYIAGLYPEIINLDLFVHL